MAIFTFSPTSNHLHPLQVETCDSNLRLVVDEDDYGKLRLERVKQVTKIKCDINQHYLKTVDLYFAKSE